MANIWSLAKLSPVNGSDISLWLNLGNNVIRGRERKERKGGRERRGEGEKEKREREKERLILTDQIWSCQILDMIEYNYFMLHYKI